MILSSVQWTVLSSPGNIKIGFPEACYRLKNISKTTISFPTTDSHVSISYMLSFPRRGVKEM